MNTDDMMCVGAVDKLAATNDLNRESYLFDGDALSEVMEGYWDFIELLEQYGITANMDAGETADLGDHSKTVVMSSSWNTRMPKDQLITFGKVKPGNVIVGISGAGQAVYETRENSSMRANGLSSAKRVLLHPDYPKQFPEIISRHAPQPYIGKFYLHDKLPGSNMNVGEALTSPTRTHLPIIKYILENMPGAINGMVHNTGSAFTKSLNFGKQLHYIKNDLFEIPPIFKNIYEGAEGKIDMEEMFRTFNNGVALEIYTDPQHADRMIEIAKLYGVDAKVIGEIAKSEDEKNHVTVTHEGNDYHYSK